MRPNSIDPIAATALTVVNFQQIYIACPFAELVSATNARRQYRRRAMPIPVGLGERLGSAK
jgi:hypothetical protein